MNICVVKFANGEEVIADVQDADSSASIRLVKPVHLVPVKNGGAGFMPWCRMAATNEFVIKLEHTILVEPVVDQIQQVYRTQFGDGLVLPIEEKKLILSE